MTPSQAEHFLIKFLSKEASSFELDQLEEWIKRPESEKVLREFVKLHYTLILGMSHSDPNAIKERLLLEMKKEKNIFRQRKIRTLLKYAAVALVFAVIGYSIQYNLNHTSKSLIPNEEAITLEMDNGDITVISENGESEIKTSDGKALGVQRGNKLVYNEGNAINELVYNTLKVPYGKKYDVYLSDGTHVYLNAGSSLKYPVKFINGESRTVSLEGEAFFDVVHNDKEPFVVNAQELDVKVYGTQFNVTNYLENSDIDVVLVRGSVALEKKSEGKNTSVMLKPGFKGAFDISEKTLSIERVNTAVYTSWLDGDLIFRKTPFKDILKRLERQYNVVIINNNEKLDEELFNATIETDKETIDQVFDYFDEVYNIDYKIFNNKVIIN